jgi:peptidoglycan/xylan/chitin deacetylase (PgdA/CDA1 family)
MDASFVQKFIAKKSRGFVTAFHDISPDKMEHLLDGFEGLQPVHLGELVNRAKLGKSTQGLFAITVDDGVSRTVASVAELCMRRSWPVTFFLPTENLDTGVGSAYEWWRQIQPLLRGRKFKLPSGTIEFPRTAVVDEMAAEMERLWHSASAASYLPITMELVAALREELGVSTDYLRPPKAVAWSTVEALSRNDLFRFESHGVSHVALSAMNEKELEKELRTSRDIVSQHTGRLCRHFAYPFGSVQSIGALAPVVAQRFYDSASTMCMGSVDSADLWMLPRIPLYPKNTIMAARLKVLLNCSSLAAARAKQEAPESIPIIADRTVNDQVKV